ncbi:MAG TPA: hypothetical protein VFN30_14115 [Chitinophagaceae bacterium]|nr:hypothetical protein [Chitinophagaceae bacterium]
MPREIRSATDVSLTAATTTNEPNEYKDRLVKLIPSEIVTAYITLQGLISGQQDNKVLFITIAFISLLIFTPFYLSKISGVSKIGQIVFTTIAFVIWVMASGGFHIMLPNVQVFDSNFLGSMILIIYTLAIPFVYKG